MLSNSKKTTSGMNKYNNVYAGIFQNIKSFFAMK